MYMANYNAVIKDSEFIDTKKYVDNFFKCFSSAMEQYCVILEKVCDEDVPSGETHDSLCVMYEYAQKVNNIIKENSKKFGKITDRYLNTVSSIGGNIYKKNIGNVTRKFDDKEYEALLKCLPNDWSDWTDRLGDWALGKIFKLFEDQVYDNKKFMMDYNNQTRETIKETFDEIKETDNLYGSGECSYFYQVSNTLEQINNLICKLAEFMNPSATLPNSNVIELELNNLYSELMESFENYSILPPIWQDTDKIDIREFTSNISNRNFFGDFENIVLKFTKNTNGLWDTIGMTVFNMFDVAENVVTDFDLNSYEEIASKRQIMDSLDNIMKNNYGYIGSENQKILNEIIEILKKDYKGSSDVVNDKYAGIDLFLKKCGKLLELGDAGWSLVSRYVLDYNKGLEILESFRANTNDADMLKYINDIERLYQRKTEAWLTEAMNDMLDVTADDVAKLLGEYSPVFKVVSTLRKSIDAVGDVTGVGEKYQHLFNSKTLHSIYTESSNAYEAAFKKAANCDPSDPEYDSVSKNLVNCFEFHKQNTIDLFNEMVGASDGTEKNYYEYCLKKAKTMTIYDSPYLKKLMSYEEYLKAYEPAGICTGVGK